MTSRHLVVGLLVLAVVLVNAAFIGLGSVFEYPDILQEDSDEILEKFRASMRARSWRSSACSPWALLCWLRSR